LVELLIVVLIVTILTAAVVPVMSPALQTRKIREAARGVSTFLAGARARAAQTGRPVGVTFVPLAANNQASMLLYLAESQPPYGGDAYGATGTLQLDGPSGSGYTLTATMDTNSFNDTLVKPGDLIQFNHQGFLYSITNVSGGTLTLYVDPKGARLPWSSSGPSADLEYTVYRAPRAGASSDPYQLPDGIIVDLAGSGEGDSGVFTLSANPVTILFSPGGRIDTIFDNNGTARPAAGSVFLLIGKNETQGSQNWNDTSADLAHLENMWVAISSTGGQVTVAEMGPGGSLPAGRAIAATGQSKGGN
jgi:type II secretory pathway pseudopilin PulG